MSDKNSGSSLGSGCLLAIVQIIFFSLLIYFSKDWSDWFWNLTWNDIGFLFLKILLMVIVGIIVQFAIQNCVTLIFESRSNLIVIVGIILPILLIVGQFFLVYLVFPDAWNWFYVVIKSWFG